MRHFAFAILLTACTSASTPSLVGTEWVLSELRGAPPVSGTRVTLKFDEKSAGGYNGCNWYGGEYESSPAGIKWGDFTQTMRGCLAPGVQEQERRYHQALAEAVAVDATESTLRMKNAAGDTLLVFTRRVPAPMNPAQLIGTKWKSSTGNGTLEFPSATTIRGFGGCREYTGTYSAKGDEIRVSSITMSSTECNQPDSGIVAEGDFTTDLSEAQTYVLADGRLELTTAGGRKVVFFAVK